MFVLLDSNILSHLIFLLSVRHTHTHIMHTHTMQTHSLVPLTPPRLPLLWPPSTGCIGTCLLPPEPGPGPLSMSGGAAGGAVLSAGTGAQRRHRLCCQPAAHLAAYRTPCSGVHSRPHFCYLARDNLTLACLSAGTQEGS